jgi:hypothetical protein
MTDDSLLDQLAEEFTQKMREGKPPDVEEFANRHPQLAGRIRELLSTLVLLEDAAANASSDQTSSKTTQPKSPQGGA